MERRRGSRGSSGRLIGARSLTARILVCGLGPAGPELITAETNDRLQRTDPHALRVRTGRHPAASVAPGAETYDVLYDQASSFVEVYQAIVDDLIALASGVGEVVYAVPGSPRVLERTVQLLGVQGSTAGVDVEVLPAMSFLDLAWVRLGVDPVEAGVRLVDGHRFAAGAAGERGPLLIAHCHNRRVLSDIKLSMDEPPDEPVLLLQRLGCPDETITEVEWSDLDRTVDPDHLTSVWIPELGAPIAGEVAVFADLVRTLREQCPWDREQTHVTLTRHALEEAYEVVEAITAWDGARGTSAEVDADEHLAEELGDLLFQVVFHATLGAERGAFTLSDVAQGIHDKLVRRHPHVFPPEGSGPDDHPSDTESLVRSWEEIKRAEKGRVSVMDGIPEGLPSLLWAHKVLRKADAAGHAWSPAESSTGTGSVEVSDAEELGERLLALVSAARTAGVDPETALRTTAGRVRDRVIEAEERPR